MHNSCDASCITLRIVRHILFANEPNVALIIALHSVRGVCCHRHAKEKLFLFRMARNLITFLSRKRQKMYLFFLSLHISHEGYQKTHITFDDSDDHESNEIFLSLSHLDFYAKTPLFHESCPRLIL